MRRRNRMAEEQPQEEHVSLEAEGGLPTEGESHKIPSGDEPVYFEGDEVRVQLASHDEIAGKYVVYDVETKQAYLVDKELVRLTAGTQKISRTVLSAAERPYGWDDEIEALRPSIADIRLALYRYGLVHRQELDLRETVARLLRQGIIPVGN